MPHSAIAVFTSKSLETLLAHGGSGPWVGAEQRVRQQEFLVCVRKERPGAEAASGVKPLTIAEANAGLAAKFGVSTDAIDIPIKG